MKQLKSMKQSIRQIIGKRFRKINASFKKLKISISPEGAHAFRLEVKHLRSFLKMLAMENHKRDIIKIPAGLKKTYKKTGKLRLIQLEEENIRKAVSQLDIHEPVHYFKTLQREEKRLEKSAKNYLGKIKSLKTDKFIHHLPSKIRQSTIQKFYESQTAFSKNLLTNEKWDEKTLHEARKILKDLLYNHVGINNCALELKISGEQMERIKELESKIGLYHDLCSYIRLLHKKKNQVNERQENISLLNIRKEWRNEKRRLIEEIERLIPLITFLNKN